MRNRKSCNWREMFSDVHWEQSFSPEVLGNSSKAFILFNVSYRFQYYAIMLRGHYNWEVSPTSEWYEPGDIPKSKISIHTYIHKYTWGTWYTYSLAPQGCQMLMQQAAPRNAAEGSSDHSQIAILSQCSQQEHRLHEYPACIHVANTRVDFNVSNIHLKTQ